MAGIHRHNLIALSDLHFGSELVQHVRPEAPRRTRLGERRDREFAALLDWYREHPVGGLPWRLVINGDFIDFAGMSVMTAPEELETEPNDEERSHGLGGARDHALAKLGLVFENHEAALTSLARFVAAGNTLVIVHGNHDVDWHWRAVQRDFRRRLARLAPFAPAQVQFAPWFYYEKDLVYLEHGHQYDALCSYDHVLFPVLPSDQRRTSRSLSDVLVRYVVRPTRGMLEAGHDALSFADYMRFAAQLGFRGMFALARRFLAANRALYHAWRESMSAAALQARSVHRRRMRAMSAAYRINLKKLRKLAVLQPPPVTRSLRAILGSVMMDSILLGLLVALLGVLGLVLLPLSYAAVTALVLAAAFGGVHRVWKGQRVLEPSAVLRERSIGVAKLFPAAFVVMGHTHLPEMTATTEVTTYVNLGAWAEEETPDGKPSALPATRTHLVLALAGQSVRAELRAWEGDQPKTLESTST
ncbi:MAG TPA: metallophosphoesterase [Polyangiaceae bacterium]